MSIARGFVGLASSSSGEGVDVVLVETSGIGLQLNARVVHHFRRQHSRDTQDLFRRTVVAHRPLMRAELSLLNRQLGESAADAVIQLVERERIDLSRVFAIGHLGPLLWHDTGSRTPSTIEAGSAASIAERTGLTTIGAFRERDVAAGGCGMPITALADWVYFRHPQHRRVLVHFGGVISIVVIPAGARPQDVIAFEAGPGTSLLDTVIQQGSGGHERFDAGGKHAVQGRCLETLLAEWLEHPYLPRRPPKSLGRSEFGPEWIDRAARSVAEQSGRLEDLLCTLSHFVVRCLVQALRALPRFDGELHLWLSGGGSRNGLFWRLLERDLPGVTLHRLDELAMPTQARPAAGAAILAAMTMDGVPAGSAGTTGAVGRLLGTLTPGDPKNWARSLRWMAEQTAPELTRPYRAA